MTRNYKPTTRYNVSTMVFNPGVGRYVECFLQTVEAVSNRDAVRLARFIVEKGEKPIVRKAAPITLPTFYSW